MAEGWARYLGGKGIEARSAGIEAHGQNSRAVKVMKEVGIDISGQKSKVLTTAMLRKADLVVTVCGHADEQCPVLPAGTRKLHWPLADPAQASGTTQEILDAFRASRDDISERVVDLLNGLGIRR